MALSYLGGLFTGKRGVASRAFVEGITSGTGAIIGASVTDSAVGPAVGAGIGGFSGDLVSRDLERKTKQGCFASPDAASSSREANTSVNPSTPLLSGNEDPTGDRAVDEKRFFLVMVGSVFKSVVASNLTYGALECWGHFASAGITTALTKGQMLAASFGLGFFAGAASSVVVDAAAAKSGVVERLAPRR